MPNIKRPKLREYPGFPKVLPCLGWCGENHEAWEPGDRFCEPCRMKKDHRASRTADCALEVWR